MTLRFRMLALLDEDIRETDYFRGKLSGQGDAALVRLSASKGQVDAEFLFTNTGTASEAASLLTDLGYSVKSEKQAAPYFTSLAAFKGSDWYKREKAQTGLDVRHTKLEKRARGLLNKLFRINKPFLGLPSGSLFELGNGITDWYVTGYEGRSMKRVWTLDLPSYDLSDDQLDELEKMLDQLEAGKRVPDSEKWKR